MENGFPHVKRIDLNEWLRYKQLPFVCEKPLSTDLNSARYLQEIAPKGSIVSFNYRYNPVIDMIMRLRNEKKLGELHFFSAEFNKNSALTRHHLTWRDSAQQSKSSGALGDLSCHLLDLFCFIGERPGSGSWDQNGKGDTWVQNQMVRLKWMITAM